MPRLQAASPRSINSSPLGPGVVIANMIDNPTPLDIADALAGDESKGFRLGALTSAPSIDITFDRQDLTENIVGLNATFKGAQQINRTDVTVGCELVELTHRNLKFCHPGFSQANWMSDVKGKVTLLTGNAAFSLVARAGGTTGNSVTITTVAGSGTLTPTTVAVVTNAITVTLGTSSGSTINATANDVVAAINASAAASALVQAGLPKTSDGTGVQTAVSSTPLAGGAAGAKIGVRFDPTGFLALTDYLNNITLALEGNATPVQQIYRVDNVIQTDDFSYTPDDSGNISGLSVTFTGSITENNFDAATGRYRPGYSIYNLDPVVTG